MRDAVRLDTDAETLRRARREDRPQREDEHRQVSAVTSVLALQRSAGNQATTHLLARSNNKQDMPGLTEEKKAPQKSQGRKKKKRNRNQQAPTFDGEALTVQLDTSAENGTGEGKEIESESEGSGDEKAIIREEEDDSKRLAEFHALLDAMSQVQLKPSETQVLAKQLCMYADLIGLLDPVPQMTLCVMIDRCVYAAQDRVGLIAMLADAKVIVPGAPKSVLGTGPGKKMASGFSMPTGQGITVVSLPDVLALYKPYTCTQALAQLKLMGVDALRLLARPDFVRLLRKKIDNETIEGAEVDCSPEELEIDVGLLKKLHALTLELDHVNKDKSWLQSDPDYGKVSSGDLIFKRVNDRFAELVAFILHNEAAFAPLCVYQKPVLQWIAESKGECNNIFATGLKVRLETLLIGERGPMELAAYLDGELKLIEAVPEFKFDTFPAEKPKK